MDHSSSPPPLDRRPPAWQRRHWTDPDQPPASSVQPPLPYSPFFPALTPEPQATWQPLFWPDDKIQRLPFVDRSDSSLGETLPGHAPTPLPDTNAPLSPDFHSIEISPPAYGRSPFGSFRPMSLSLGWSQFQFRHLRCSLQPSGRASALMHKESQLGANS